MNDRVSFTIANGVADVRLIRVDKANALDRAMFDALIECGETLKKTQGLRAVVISGDGKGFCAGIDMSVLADIKNGVIAGEKDLVSRTYGVCNRFQYAAWVWHELQVPVIAAIHGFALGGGFQLALGADLRFVTPSTKMSLMEIKWGLVPDMGATQLMYGLAREDIIRDLGYTGRIFDGNEALQYGFATRLCEDPLQEAMEAAREIASKSPDAMRALKRLFNGVYDNHSRQRLIDETTEQQALMGTRNQVETILANREKRTPLFDDPTI